MRNESGFPRIALIECVGGASGNMLLGALVDAGLDQEALLQALRRLPLPSWTWEVRRVWRSGITATHLEFIYPAESTARHLTDILAIITASKLPADVQAPASAIFERLAAAEAQVHGISIDEVHFHEVGAVDAILDIVGFCVGLSLLGVDEVHATPLPVGQGSIACAHGLMPNPAPATAALMLGVPQVRTTWPGELVTPTGAAIITTLARSYQLQGALLSSAIGYGAGSRDAAVPNVTRITLATRSSPARSAPASPACVPSHSEAQLSTPLAPSEPACDEVVELRCNLDDMSPQHYEHAAALLFAAGALDVWTTPAHMKKQRPGTVLSVLTHPAGEAECTTILLEHTTTLGVRRLPQQRVLVARSEHIIETPLGSARVKIAHRRVPTLQPEHDDCRRLATQHGLPLSHVVEVVRQAATDLLTTVGHPQA